VHSFITIRLDYCLSLYSGLPSVRLASLSRVIRSAARLIGQIPKFGHGSSYMLEVLHWLQIRQRIEYRVASLVWRCQLGLAPTYLIDLCRPVLGSRSSRSLLSSERGLLPVPFARTTIMLAALALLWPRRYGIASLLRSASYQGHFQTHSIIIKNCSF